MIPLAASATATSTKAGVASSWCSRNQLLSPPCAELQEKHGRVAKVRRSVSAEKKCSTALLTSTIPIVLLFEKTWKGIVKMWTRVLLWQAVYFDVVGLAFSLGDPQVIQI